MRGVCEGIGGAATLTKPLRLSITHSSPSALSHSPKTLIISRMDLSDRDRAIVAAVARFGQMSSKQIRALIFDDVSATPCDRALQRLARSHYLIRIEHRMVGGAKGGSGQYVYTLGRRGFYLFNTGRFNPARTVNYHSLTIVDCYLTIRKLESAGVLDIKGYSAEPDCWVTVGGQELRPDLYIELDRRGLELRAFLEIDMATEGQRKIREKLTAYWKAYNSADVPVFPLVLFVAVDDERAKELAWMIEQGQEPRLFRVVTKHQFYSVFV